MDQSMVAKVSEAPVDAIIKRQAIIIYGNPVDGFSFIGPFKTREEAADFGNTDAHLDGPDWWVAELETPMVN